MARLSRVAPTPLLAEAGSRAPRALAQGWPAPTSWARAWSTSAATAAAGPNAAGELSLTESCIEAGGPHRGPNL